MTARVALVAAMSLVVAGAAGAAGASMSGWFFAHRGAVYCATELFPHEGSGRFLQCWRPRTGFTVLMSYQGRPEPRRGYARRGLRMPTEGVLRVGETGWVSRDRRRGRGRPPAGALFRCSVRPTGLTCVNRDGHGWSLGAQGGHRLF